MSKKQRSWWYLNSLSLTLLGFFLIMLLAQSFFGWKVYQEELLEKSSVYLPFLTYLHSGHFISATFENFQSEFLQMAVYILLTVSLRQIGSAESKKINQAEDVDRIPKPGKNTPAAVQAGGWRLTLYSNSLSIAFAILFLVSWGMHLYGSYQMYNTNQALLHRPLLSLTVFLTKPEFWFETFQNWQSEFLSVASIVVLTIFLRQKGSPQSKPVDASHSETGR